MLKKSLKWLNENYKSLLEGIFVLMLATTIAVLYQRLSGGIEEGIKELNTTYTYKVELAHLSDWYEERSENKMTSSNKQEDNEGGK